MKSELLASVAGFGMPSDGSLDTCKVIQGMSAELKRGNKRFQEAARVGDIFFAGRNPPIIPGETGLNVLLIHPGPRSSKPRPTARLARWPNMRETQASAIGAKKSTTKATSTKPIGASTQAPYSRARCS
jgi:hypothetical protein